MNLSRTCLAGLLVVNLCFICASLTAQPDTLARTLNKRSPQPVLTRGPYLQAATSSSIVIRWRTNAGERSVVRYGTDPNRLTDSVENTMITNEHIVKLSKLQPRTTYYYSIGGLTHTLQGGKGNYFMTLPEPGSRDRYRIAAFGDCGNNSLNQRMVRNEVLKYLGDNYLDAWLLLGDNAYESGTDAEYQVNFFDVFKDDLLKRYPLFPAPGNHDYRDIGKYRGVSQATQDVPYYQIFTMPVDGEGGGVASRNPAYYSFDIGNVHFLSLDSYGKEEKTLRMFDTLSPQVEWVKKDLAANRHKDWVVAYWHHPPYTMGSHNSDRETELVKIRENFVRILERYGVDMVLCGHSHNYERSKLIKGHYGKEATFNAAEHNVSESSGLYDGSKNSCPYLKDNVKQDGIVYVVSGSAGKIDPKAQATYPHDAMYYSNVNNGGALLMEVEGSRLDMKWICADGEIRDAFTMMKNVNSTKVVKVKKGQATTLTASFVGKYKWNRSASTSRSITITPKKGKTTYIVEDNYNCLKDVFEVVVD